MDELATILQKTLDLSREVRESAESVIKDHIESEEFISTLAQFGSNDAFPFHLRQLTIVLITQQIHKRWRLFSNHMQTYLIEFSLYCIKSQNSYIRHSGISMLANITHQRNLNENVDILDHLISLLQIFDINSIVVYCKCLYEILLECNFSTQLYVMKRCHALFINIIQGIDNSHIFILRQLFKLVKLIVSRICVAKIGEELEKELSLEVNCIFVEWLRYTSDWCVNIGCVTQMDPRYAVDILRNTPILIEIVDLQTYIIECYSETDAKILIGLAVQHSWNILGSLSTVYLHHDVHDNSSLVRNEDLYDEYDGDRVTTDILVMKCLCLLRVYLTSSSDLSESNAVLGNAQYMTELLRMIVTYIQLNEEQLSLFYSNGNEFFSLDQTQEDSSNFDCGIRDLGKEFILELLSVSPAIYQVVLTFVNQQCDMLYTSHIKSNRRFSDLSNNAIPLRNALMNEFECIVPLQTSQLLWLESLIFVMICIGKRYLKKANKKKLRYMESNDVYHMDGIVRELAEVKNLIQNIIVPFISVTTQAGGINIQSYPLLCSASFNLCSMYISLFDFQDISCLLSSMFHLTRHGHALPFSLVLQCIRSFGVIIKNTRDVTGISNESMPSLKYPSATVLEEFVNNAIEISKRSNENTLHVVLESITVYLDNSISVIKSCSNALASSSDDGSVASNAGQFNHFVLSQIGISYDSIVKLTSLVVTVWTGHETDPFLIELARELLCSTLLLSAKYTVNDEIRSKNVEVFASVYLHFIHYNILNAQQGFINHEFMTNMAIRLLVESCVTSLSIPLLKLTVEVILHAIPLSFQALTNIPSQARPQGSNLFEQFRNICMLMSREQLSLKTNFSSEQHNSLLQIILEYALRALSSNSNDRSAWTPDLYAAGGVLCQLVNEFNELIPNDMLHSIVHRVFSLLSSYPSSNNSKYVLAMVLVHLLTRFPSRMTNILHSMPSTDGNSNALAVMIDVWFELHDRINSKYNLVVSTFGWLELMKMYVQYGKEELFLLRCVRTVLQSLPMLLMSDYSKESEAEWNDHYSASIGSEVEDLYSDASDIADGETEDNHSPNVDVAEISGCGQNSPFADAELYLSDLMETSRQSAVGSDRITPFNSSGIKLESNTPPLHLDDNMMYSPFKLDPIWSRDLQQELGVWIYTENRNKSGLLYATMRRMTKSEEDLIHALKPVGDDIA